MPPESDATASETSRDPFFVAADTMGHDLLAALLGELRSMPDHWARLNAERQQVLLDNLKGKIRATVERAVVMLMRGELAAVDAELDKVAWGSDITATLSIRRDALYRHALSDAQGQKVLVVLTDSARWTQRMDEIKAKGDQLELWGNDYDPAVDQPGYRRDQDRIAPAGQTWADLKKSLSGSTAPPQPEGDEAPTSEGEKINKASEDTAPPGETNLTPAQQRAVDDRILQEKLATLGITISLGRVMSCTPDGVAEALKWVDAYMADGESCTIERPSWIPEMQRPTPPPSSEEGDTP